jgi:hypothetical protein
MSLKVEGVMTQPVVIVRSGALLECDSGDVGAGGQEVVGLGW